MAQRKSRINAELLDELLAGEDPREAFQSGELFAELQKSLAERVLGAEMEAHLSSEEEVGSGNHRNGHNRKRVLTGRVRWSCRFRGTERDGSIRS